MFVGRFGRLVNSSLAYGVTPPAPAGGLHAA